VRAAAANLLNEQLNGWGIFQQVIPSDANFDVDEFQQPTYQVSLTLTQPWIAGARTSASVSAFAGRRLLIGTAVDEDAGASVGSCTSSRPESRSG
jgi:hypothetical protein